jgi:hypothetical protein
MEYLFMEKNMSRGLEGGNRMNRILAILIVMIFLCSSALAAELKKMSLDDASILGTTIQTDSDVKTEGQASVRIATRFPTTNCMGEVNGFDLENARLVYKAKVKSDLNGSAYLEMWVHIGNGRYFSKGLNDPVKGKSDWRSIQTPFIFQKGQNPNRITLNIVINGQGTVWIDDLVLIKAPLK